MKSPARTVPYAFVLADVFTEHAFGGNQLAVVPEANGLTDHAMQTLAREFNFSETVFIFPPESPKHSYRLRIFTPQKELPFAGHPTVGAAAVLTHLNKADPGAPAPQLILEEGVGPIRVSVGRSGDVYQSELAMTPTLEELAPAPSKEALASVLSLTSDGVRDTWCASVGVPFCLVQLANPALVDQAVLDRAAWHTHLGKTGAPHLFFFAGACVDHSEVYARMMAPAFGIDEDPATGAACAALVASLAARRQIPDGTFHLNLRQGVHMGRPSFIEAAAEKVQGRITEVRIGGASTIVASGTAFVPEAALKKA